jgi:hypothetical protein
MDTTYRMQCGKRPNHPQLYAVPQGARIDWGGLAPWVLDEQGQHLRCKVDGCNRAMRAVAVKGKLGTQECGDRCTSATGPACECKCKGENHGGGAW